MRKTQICVFRGRKRQAHKNVIYISCNNNTEKQCASRENRAMNISENEHYLPKNNSSHFFFLVVILSACIACYCIFKIFMNYLKKTLFFTVLLFSVHCFAQTENIPEDTPSPSFSDTNTVTSTVSEENIESS